MTLLLFGLLAVVGLSFAVRSALHADDNYAAEGQYYPVSIAKYLFLDVVTLGFYGIFWRWKCWRWAKTHGGQDIAPFWRTLFAVIWLYPLFEQVNARLEKRRLPGWLGISAAVFYVAFSFGAAIVNRWPGAPKWLQIVALFSFVCVLPVALAVTRLNGENSAVLRANSRFSWHTWLTIVIGAICWVLVVLGLSG